MNTTLHVDVWSDIACPWCYLGKRRFDEGVALFQRNHPGVQVNIVSRSFELAPDTPLDFAGSEVDFLVKHKGMPREQVTQMLDQMTQLGQSEGITFDFAALRHTNTRRAHRVLHLAAARGMQAELMERLFEAYFAQGRLISDPDTLAELGGEVGLDPADVRAAFDDEALGEAVDRDIAQARAFGINGVPFWVIDNRYGLSGAQPAEQVAAALAQACTPLVSLDAQDADACGPDGC